MTGEACWENDAPSFTPEWVQTFLVPRAQADRISVVCLSKTRPRSLGRERGCTGAAPFLISSATPGKFYIHRYSTSIRLFVGASKVALLVKDLIEQLALRLVPRFPVQMRSAYRPLHTYSIYELIQPFAHSVAQSREKNNGGDKQLGD
jgi:hypothetical protein